MKKMFAPVVLLFIFLLSGCFGGGPESVIKELYKAGLENDKAHISKLLSHAEEELDERELTEIAEMLAEEVMSVNGVKNIKMKKIERKQVRSDAVEDLDDAFGKGWGIVLSQTVEENHIHAWVLKKIDNTYYILDGENFDEEELKGRLIKVTQAP